MIFQTKKSLLAILAVGFWLALSAQTSVDEVPKGWHLKDLNTDGFYGISLDKAYNFVKSKKSQTVIVAVIDSGIDTLHEDLKSVLWVNRKEIPGNGIDDDHNGYVDDVHGWNFLGGKDGRNVKEDSYEGARVYHKYKAQFEKIKDTTSLPKEDLYNYKMWKKAENQVVGNGKESGMSLLILKRTYSATLKADSILKAGLGKESYTGNDLESFTPATDIQKKAKSSVLFFFTNNNSMDMTNKALLEDFKNYLDGEERKAEAVENAPKDYRGDVVQDNYNDFNDRSYGNNDVMASTPFHGTHVSGIIAAARNNGIGIDGIANNVKIMMVRAVPDGDEHDKDIALAIRYAVDNGARVINMSFGKGFSPEKSWVDDAVKYAAGKGVLLVHAAGNDHANVDTVENYPCAAFKDKSGKASNWITVGASGVRADDLIASFSNYGKKDVDVFAPGVKIYSTVPGGNTYGDAQGTSMASPVVAGVAAFVLSYYPKLTPQQLKYIIEKSAVKPKDEGPSEDLTLSEACVTGGIVNVYEAIKLADSMSKSKIKAVKKPVAKPVTKKKAA